MRPEEVMHPLIDQSLRRYIGYGWGNALIQSLIRYRFNVKLPQRCLTAFRQDSVCTPHCQSSCPFRNNVM